MQISEVLFLSIIILISLSFIFSIYVEERWGLGPIEYFKYLFKGKLRVHKLKCKLRKDDEVLVRFKLKYIKVKINSNHHLIKQVLLYASNDKQYRNLRYLLIFNGPWTYDKIIVKGENEVLDILFFD